MTINKSHSMTPQQQLTLRRLRAEGYELVAEQRTVLVVRRGNNWQLIRMDGMTQRATGATGNHGKRGDPHV